MSTPKRDTMHLRGKVVVGILSSFLLAGVIVALGQGLAAQNAEKVQPTPLPKAVDPSDPALPVWLRPANARPVAAPPTPKPGANPAENPINKQPQPAPEGTVGEVTKSSSGGFVLRVRSDEVTLQATVVDPRSHLITTLNKDSFTVYEDNQQQQITSFRREDIPVSIGIVVDNSDRNRNILAAKRCDLLLLVIFVNREAVLVQRRDQVASGIDDRRLQGNFIRSDAQNKAAAAALGDLPDGSFRCRLGLLIDGILSGVRARLRSRCSRNRTRIRRT